MLLSENEVIICFLFISQVYENRKRRACAMMGTLCDLNFIFLRQQPIRLNELTLSDIVDFKDPE
jgi:hypothetical protein